MILVLLSFTRSFCVGNIYNFSHSLIRDVWGLGEFEEDLNDESIDMNDVMSVVTGGKITV